MRNFFSSSTAHTVDSRKNSSGGSSLIFFLSGSTGGVGGAEGASSPHSRDFCLPKAARAFRFARFISRELSGFDELGTSSCTGLWWTEMEVSMMESEYKNHHFIARFVLVVYT